MPDWSVRLDVFVGPLDLLLRLIERRRLDVTTVSLALVTEQFLQHVATLPRVEPEVLASFIAIAAKLLVIKSRALLPAPADASGPDDSRPFEVDDNPTDLTARLREYERYRNVARALREREERGLRSYPVAPRRLAPSPPTPNLQSAICNLQSPVAPSPRSLRGLRPDDLLQAYRRALTRSAPSVPTATVEREPFPVEQALAIIRAQLAQLRALDRPLEFRAYARATASRSLAVALFLAALELLRLGVVEAEQTEPFGEIRLALRPMETAD
ncbi:MAG: segregation/condensation protein A [Chloroflexi bacterium]|nr:segregation/condensation protein A [Chloroflexota bacterium]